MGAANGFMGTSSNVNWQQMQAQQGYGQQSQQGYAPQQQYGQPQGYAQQPQQAPQQPAQAPQEAPAGDDPAKMGAIWYCPKCGNKNDGNFCPKDGTPKPQF